MERALKISLNQCILLFTTVFNRLPHHFSCAMESIIEGVSKRLKVKSVNVFKTPWKVVLSYCQRGMSVLDFQVIELNTLGSTNLVTKGPDE